MPQTSKQRQWGKTYRLKHRELCHKRNQDWHKRNAESERAKSRAERKAVYADPVGRKNILARNKAWRDANKHKIRDRDLRRKARLKGARLENPQLISEWMNRIRLLRFVRCYWCGTKVKGRRVHFDHILALAAGGAHSIDNLCASCAECNCSRQAKAVANWDKHAQLFLSI